MTRPALFEREACAPQPRWTGRSDVMPSPPHRCPDCRSLLSIDVGADVLALFWMHGFGAVIRTTHVTCRCGYRRHWKTQTITPKQPNQPGGLFDESTATERPTP